MSETKEVVSIPVWYEAETEHLSQYKELLSNKLHDIVIPTYALLCDNNQCCNLIHCIALNKYMNDITACCLTSAKCTIPCTKITTLVRATVQCQAGQNNVEPVRSKAIFWHDMWLSCGKPHSGFVADIMRKCRASYHYAVRRLKKDSQNVVKGRFASALLDSSGTRDF